MKKFRLAGAVENNFSVNWVLILATACCLCGCASAPPMIPISSADAREALEIIQSTGKRYPAEITHADAEEKTLLIVNRLIAHANRKCVEYGELSADRCRAPWEYSVSQDSDFNAFAYGKKSIAVTTGALSLVKSDDELAFILAHEFGHHIANHLSEQKMSSYVGELVGGVLSAGVTVLVAGALGLECNPEFEDCDYLTDLVSDSFETGAIAGREVAVMRYSRQQEAEADRIAADIISSAGFNLDRAIELYAYLGGVDGNIATFSSFGDSHPTDLERLAQLRIFSKWGADSHSFANLRASAEDNNSKAQIALGRKSVTKGHDEDAIYWFNRAAALEDPEAQFILGLLCYEGKGVKKDKNMAARWYYLAANQGYSAAQGMLGYQFASGDGVDEDLPEAAKWYRMAAKQGHYIAQANLGSMLLNGSAIEEGRGEAVKWITAAAERGHTTAQYELGNLYRFGAHVPKNLTKALYWYRKSAEQGDADAQYYTGRAYLNGEGVTLDLREANKWFRLSASQGNAAAQADLGFSYWNEEGVEKDIEEGLKWTVLAADKGVSQAQHNLAVAYGEGLLGDPDFELARFWFDIAAKQGRSDSIAARHRLYLEEFGLGLKANEEIISTLLNETKEGNAKAQFALGFAYDYSIMFEENIEKAVYYYQLAAAQGLRDAQFILGLIYDRGDRVVKADKAKAFNWYGLAAEQGHTAAQYYLAQFLDNGVGVEQNKELAKKWYLSAAQQGHPSAQNNLGYGYLSGDYEKNFNEAFKWLSLAAKSGEPNAATNLGWYHFTESAAPFNLNYKEAFRWNKAGAEGGHTNAHSNLALHYFTGYGVAQNFRKMVEHLILSAELFTEGFRWVTEGPDEWLDYKDLAPKEFMDARSLWWQAVTTGEKKYIRRLKALI